MYCAGVSKVLTEVFYKISRSDEKHQSELYVACQTRLQMKKYTSYWAEKKSVAAIKQRDFAQG